MKSQGKNTKYPENQRYRRVLKRGDLIKLAALSGYTRGTINEILGGRCLATTRFQKAFLELIKEKEELKRQVNEVIGKE